MASLVTGWLLAVLLGARHASEPDHMVAVSTLLAGTRDVRRATWLGAMWGIGHSITLLLVGVGLMGLHRSMSARVGALFELAVALMLLLLGARSLARAVALGRAGRTHLHSHGHAHAHRHAGSPDHVHVSSLTLARRPLAVGLVHGLAGSGALSALALANMPSFGSAVIYIACFGAGSVIGMMALTGLVGLPLARFGGHERVQAWLFAAAGTGSLILGVLWGWPQLSLVAGS
jgi:hypothetical protein